MEEKKELQKFIEEISNINDNSIEESTIKEKEEIIYTDPKKLKLSK